MPRSGMKAAVLGDAPEVAIALRRFGLGPWERRSQALGTAVERGGMITAASG